MLTNLNRDAVARRTCFEKRFEVQRLVCELALRKPRPIAADRRQRPAAGLGLRTSFTAAVAGSAVRTHGNMAPQYARLPVQPDQRPSTHRRNTADARAERKHHNLRDSTRRPHKHLSAQRKPCIVLKTHGNAEILSCPAFEVEHHTVVVL